MVARVHALAVEEAHATVRARTVLARLDRVVGEARARLCTDDVQSAVQLERTVRAAVEALAILEATKYARVLAERAGS